MKAADDYRLHKSKHDHCNINIKSGREMSKAEDLAKRLYPDPRMEDYDDILVYRADRDNASMGRINVVRVYEQAEKDLAPLIEAATIVYEAWNGGTMDDVRSGMVELGKQIKEAKK